MRYAIILICGIGFGVFASIAPQECITLNGDVGKSMYLSMIEDLQIDRSVIAADKTKAEIISEEPVTYSLAMLHGNKEKFLSGENSDDSTTEDDYARGFMSNNTKNIIVKYTFEDKKARHNIFLASAFIDDNDCAVRFNDYIIVKREF